MKRILSTLSNVQATTIVTATGTGRSPGTTVLSTSLSPSPTTAGRIKLLIVLTPRMTKPASGPSVCATITYSPPATGQAEESSA